MTSDKDCRQLISDRVTLLNIRKNQVFDRESLKDDWGIAPEQVVDFQALVGDSVDNVPGVPGVGRKTASRLQDLNILTVGNLRVLSRELLGAMFGRCGEALYERCHSQCCGNQHRCRSIDPHLRTM